jgi:hypothetical protein
MVKVVLSNTFTLVRDPWLTLVMSYPTIFPAFSIIDSIHLRFHPIKGNPSIDTHTNLSIALAPFSMVLDERMMFPMQRIHLPALSP